MSNPYDGVVEVVSSGTPFCGDDHKQMQKITVNKKKSNNLK